MNRTVIKKAHAKVNLTLDVLGRRADGYHLVDMIMQEISLHDLVEIRILEADSVDFVSMELKDLRNRMNISTTEEENKETVHGGVGSTAADAIPVDDSNLMVRAAKLMMKTYGLHGHIHMVLSKRIPSQAGLAGGSTDAAAVITGMNDLYELHRPQEELMQLGTTLGADIPFCILGGTARAEGIGEKLTALTPLAGAGLYLLLVKPELGGSTPKIYAAFDAEAERLGAQLVHPDTPAAAEAIAAQDITKLFSAMGNVLEYAVCPTAPMAESADGETTDLIHALRAELLKRGAAVSMMSGSGSTVFGVFTDPETRHRAFHALQQQAARFGIADLIEAEPV